MDVQALVGIDFGKWVAKIDTELVLFRHLGDYSVVDDSSTGNRVLGIKYGNCKQKMQCVWRVFGDCNGKIKVLWLYLCRSWE